VPKKRLFVSWVVFGIRINASPGRKLFQRQTLPGSTLFFFPRSWHLMFVLWIMKCQDILGHKPTLCLVSDAQELHFIREQTSSSQSLELIRGKLREDMASDTQAPQQEKKSRKQALGTIIC